MPSVVEIHATIVGAGALGNELCKALGSVGFREILLIDPDKIEPHNIASCSLLKAAGVIGQSKARSLAAICQRIFPDTQWRAIQSPIADIGFATLAAADMLFSCVDNELARLEIAYIGLKLSLPVCDAGIKDHDSGRVSFFPARTQASFCCMLPPARRRELLTLWSSPSFPCWSNGRQEHMPWRAAPQAAELAASLQAQAALEYFFAPSERSDLTARTTEFRVSSKPEFSTFHIPRSVDCPFHEHCSEQAILLPAGLDTTIGELLRAADEIGPNPALILDWPVCTRSRCGVCGWRRDAPVRLTALRRTEKCSKCGSRQLTALQVIHRIGHDSELAHWQLGALGIPENHLHTICYQLGLPS